MYLEQEIDTRDQMIEELKKELDMRNYKVDCMNCQGAGCPVCNGEGSVIITCSVPEPVQEESTLISLGNVLAHVENMEKELHSLSFMIKQLIEMKD